MKTRAYFVAVSALTIASAPYGSSHAQCADCGPDYNKEDGRRTEYQGVVIYDKPVQKDPLGNAIIGGGVSGIVKGSFGAAVQSAITGTAIGTMKEKFKGPSKKRMDGEPKPPATIRSTNSSGKGVK